MPVVINDIDENVESADSYTPDLAGSDNLLFYGGLGIDTGSIGAFDGATQGATSFTAIDIHDTETTFGTRTFIDAGGYILDASIPSGASTFTQNVSGTVFNDTSFHLLSLSGVDQATPVAPSPSPVTYNLTVPGAITFSIGANGGLAILQVTDNGPNAPTTPSGWTAQGANKTLDIITDYRIYTRIYTSQQTDITVTPVADGTGTMRGYSRVTIINAAATGGSFTLTADTESYAYGGTDAGALLSALLSGDTEAYNYTGAAADLALGKVIAADTEQYTYGGTVTDLILAAVLPSDTDQYTYSGTDAGILAGVALSSDTEQYNYTGTAADLTFGSVGNFTLTADTELYAYSGTDSGLLYGANLIADTEQYNYTGAAATLTRNFNLSADASQYTYAGTEAALQSDLIVISDSGSYIITGTAVTITASGDSIWTDTAITTTSWTAELEQVTGWSDEAKTSTVWTVV